MHYNLYASKNDHEAVISTFTRVFPTGDVFTDVPGFPPFIREAPSIMNVSTSEIIAGHDAVVAFLDEKQKPPPQPKIVRAPRQTKKEEAKNAEVPSSDLPETPLQDVPEERPVEDKDPEKIAPEVTPKPKRRPPSRARKPKVPKEPTPQISID